MYCFITECQSTIQWIALINHRNLMMQLRSPEDFIKFLITPLYIDPWALALKLSHPQCQFYHYLFYCYSNWIIYDLLWFSAINILNAKVSIFREKSRNFKFSAKYREFPLQKNCEFSLKLQISSEFPPHITGKIPVICFFKYC